MASERLQRMLRGNTTSVGGDFAPIQLTPEQEEGLVSQVGNAGLSALAAFGNAAGLPQSSIFDLLTGQNPFDQWATPFSSENRATGRDVLSHYGVMSKNDPDKWEVEDVLAGAFEVVADPFWFLKPVSALGQAGKLAKSARLLDNVTDLARSAGKGKRAFLTSTTLRDILPQVGAEGFERLSQTAKAQGKSMRELLREVGDQPLAHKGGIGLPFQANPIIPADGLADYFRIPERFDRAGEAIRFGNLPFTQYSPGRHAAQLFRASSMGRATRAGQEVAEGL